MSLSTFAKTPFFVFMLHIIKRPISSYIYNYNKFATMLKEFLQQSAKPL